MSSSGMKRRSSRPTRPGTQKRLRPCTASDAELKSYRNEQRVLARRENSLDSKAQDLVHTWLSERSMLFVFKRLGMTRKCLAPEYRNIAWVGITNMFRRKGRFREHVMGLLDQSKLLAAARYWISDKLESGDFKRLHAVIARDLLPTGGHVHATIHYPRRGYRIVPLEIVAFGDVFLRLRVPEGTYTHIIRDEKRLIATWRTLHELLHMYRSGTLPVARDLIIGPIKDYIMCVHPEWESRK